MAKAAALALLALSALFISACAHPPAATFESSSSAAPAVPAVRFVALGDAGTGGADQWKVAAAIGRVCAASGCDFALDLGDNIYEAGASSADDPQFGPKFEAPYANLTMPFWMALGNHDNTEDPSGSGATAGFWYPQGDNEVAYAHRTDRPTTKWHMPDRFYNVSFGAGGNRTGPPLVDLVVLDTNTLLFEDVPFPPDTGARVQAQAAWVDGALAAAHAPWRIAAGHHPYVSNGPHGNAGSYDGHAGVPGQSGDYTKRFFEAHVCGKVDAYLSGHDHDLEWLAPVPSCGKTEFIVSGGGGAATYALAGTDTARFQKESLGFWWIEATGKSWHAVAYNADAQALFDQTLTRAP